MSIEAIATVGSAALGSTAIDAPFSLQTSAVMAPQRTNETFSALVDAVGSLNEQMRSNDRAMQAVALGETGNLHQVMMNIEKTRLTFELALQVRNKALEAYQELMRMQV